MTAYLYGLDKCETCKKARNWLARHEVEHEFVDYREHRPEPTVLKTWATAAGGWEKLVNRSGMTWRNLPAVRKSPGSDPEWQLLVKEYPALVRRPVVVMEDGAVHFGFTDKLFANLFASDRP